MLWCIAADDHVDVYHHHCMKWHETLCVRKKGSDEDVFDTSDDVLRFSSLFGCLLAYSCMSLIPMTNSKTHSETPCDHPMGSCDHMVLYQLSSHPSDLDNLFKLLKAIGIWKLRSIMSLRVGIGVRRMMLLLIIMMQEFNDDHHHETYIRSRDGVMMIPVVTLEATCIRAHLSPPLLVVLYSILSLEIPLYSNQDMAGGGKLEWVWMDDSCISIHSLFASFYSFALREERNAASCTTSSSSLTE